MNIIKATDTVRIVALARPDNLLVQVWDDDTWRTATTADTYEDARPLANLAHNVLRGGGDAADAIIAVLTTRAEETCRRYAGFDMGEAVWGEINVHLGMCPDGCCGGPRHDTSAPVTTGPSSPRASTLAASRCERCWTARDRDRLAPRRDHSARSTRMCWWTMLGTKACG